MTLSSKKLLISTLIALLCLNSLINASDDNERQIYIVYMGELPEYTISLSDVHQTILSDIIGDELLARQSKIHSYGRSFNAFAARLLPREAELLSQKEGVVSVFKNKMLKLLTTRSWDFVGMSQKVKRNYPIESNTVVALLDTGLWPESPSFDDKGFGPPPLKWKGKCLQGSNFTGCNNKVIGAQFFNLGGMVQPDETTPLDTDGHGTHTASTAAGAAVESASLYGIGEGTARGAVPSARIASYKVCWGIGCMDVDMLAAFDAAIADGVDIISVSIGGSVRSFTEDSIGIGSFHALKKGILTVCAGGNDGPYLGSISNVGPWIMTVAASTIDRRFETAVELGNGDKISGIAINTFAPNGFYPMTTGALAHNNGTFGNASACEFGTLDAEKVKGKIVYCQGPGGDYVVKELGGMGTVMSNDQNVDTAFAVGSSASYVSLEDGLKIEKYINSTKSAQGVIYKTKIVKASAPFVASFSSRGPQLLLPNILKPDISAPGVNILAAITKFATVIGHEGDKKPSQYNFNSGTSMACPHVAGAAAYVKSFHPLWSQAAIKSALMTTSKPIKAEDVGAELASGSGQINPRRAVHPGLIYDTDTISYVGLLCKQGYKDKDIALITGSKYNCSNVPKGKGADGINYPSIHLQVENRESEISAVFYRKVTNVGVGKSVYKAKVKSPKGISVKVFPDVLKFSRPNQKRSFKVTLKGKFADKEAWYLSGSLLWSDSKHDVRSPILVSLSLS